MNNFSFGVVTVLFLMAVGCNPSKNAKKSGTAEAAIFSVLIDEMATSFPPPPPPSKDGSKSKTINIDSLNKVKVEVVVDTIMFEMSETRNLKQTYSEYQKLVDSIPYLSAKPINTKYIESKKGHSLIFGDSLDDSNTKYPQLIGISRISFNKKMNKAAVYGGYSTGSLSSYVNLYLFEKINGEWKIVHEKSIAVS